MFSIDAPNEEKLWIFEQIETKYAEIKARIEAAAQRSGRSASDVLLVAVSKYAGSNDGIIEGFLQAGIYDLAENRPQALLAKAQYWDQVQSRNTSVPRDFVPSCSRSLEATPTIHWHYIGNLQRNKARRILPYVSLIHSVDSWKLLQTLERILQEESERTPLQGAPHFPNTVSVLLEANISGDDTKQGTTLQEIEYVLPQALELKHIKVCGLMGMSGLRSTADETRRQFASLRETLERCQNRYPEMKSFRELSIGMSDDFEIAIEEGATIVRIGSSLYPERS